MNVKQFSEILVTTSKGCCSLFLYLSVQQYLCEISVPLLLETEKEKNISTFGKQN